MVCSRMVIVGLIIAFLAACLIGIQTKVPTYAPEPSVHVCRKMSLYALCKDVCRCIRMYVNTVKGSLDSYSMCDML